MTYLSSVSELLKGCANHTQDLKQSSEYPLTHVSLPMPSTLTGTLTPPTPANEAKENAKFSPVSGSFLWRTETTQKV